MISIKSASGAVKYETPINEGCKRKMFLMREDFVTLKFSLPERIVFGLGDNVEIPNDETGLFEIITPQYPEYNPETGGYDYDLRFDAYYMKWGNKVMKFLPEVGGRETSFHVTADLATHLNILIRNIKSLGYRYKGIEFNFSIDASVEKSAKLISYDKTSIIDALNRYAETWNCEWWITNNTIRFGRCELGASVEFSLADNVETMKRTESSGRHATRIYAFGSTRNIPKSYRPLSIQPTISGVVQKRLLLPQGTDSVDAYPNMRQEEAIEDVVVFDDIYPKRIGAISTISTKQYTDTTQEQDGSDTQTNWDAYRFTDTGINFSKDYVIPGGEGLKIIFQSGKLNGMEFELWFNPDNKPEKNGEEWNVEAQIYEIKRNEEYGRPLPDAVLHPEVGDKYILSGFDISLVSDAYVSSAEQELKQKAEEYVNKSKTDTSLYECTMMSDRMITASEESSLYNLGQRVKLLNDAYFNESGRASRIIGYEYNLDIPYDSPIYSVGEKAPISRFDKIEGRLQELTFAGQTFVGGVGGGAGSSGTSIYIITSNDTTAPTDSNTLSALRAMKEFLSKHKDDTAEGLIKFLKGAKFGDFLGGTAGRGGSIDDKGDAELNSLFVRRFLEVPELRYNRTDVQVGNEWNAPGGGLIESVKINYNSSGYPLMSGEATLKLENGEVGAIAVGDLCMGIFHDPEGRINSQTDLDDSKGGFKFAGFYTVYFKVTKIIGERNSRFKYTLRPDDFVSWDNMHHPHEAMTFVSFGNTTDPKRQTSRYSTRTYERYLKGVNDWVIGKDNIGAQFGDLSNLSVHGLNMTGYSAYLNNVYMSGVIEQFEEQATRYWLVPSVTQIKRSKDGSLSHGYVSCKRLKRVGNDPAQETTEKILKYQISDRLEEFYTQSVSVPTNAKWIEFRLYESDGALIDVSTINVVDDGKDGEKGDSVQGNPGNNIIQAFKKSVERPATPKQTEQERTTQTTPSGWSASPASDATTDPNSSIGISGISYGGDWTIVQSGQNTGYYASSTITHNGFTKQRVSFTAKQGGKLIIDLAVSSEQNYDLMCAGNLDVNVPNASTARTNYKERISGTQTKRVVYDNIPAGNHFVDISYLKDGSGSNGQDKGWFKVTPPQTTGGDGEGIWWVSSATQVYSSPTSWRMSDWSVPVRYEAEQGRGIADVKKYYLASEQSNGITHDSLGWSTNMQSATAEKPYLWAYEKIEYTDGAEPTKTPPIIILTFGRGIKEMTVYYLATPLNVGVTHGTQGWTTTVQLMTPTNKYLWSYTHTLFTDDTFKKTDPAIVGTYGEKGEKGDSIHGCIYRQTEWVKGVEYRNDESLTTGTRFIDVALRKNGAGNYNAYICKVTHTSSFFNRPPNKNFWQPMNNMAPIRTPLIIADNAVFKFAQTNQILVMKSDGTTVNAAMGGGDYPLWIGAPNPDDAPFKVGADGTAYCNNLKARGGVVAGNPDGQRAELNPASKSLDIFNVDGEMVTTFEGYQYGDIGSLFSNTSGTLTILKRTGYDTYFGFGRNVSLGKGRVYNLNGNDNEIQTIHEVISLSEAVHTAAPVEFRISGALSTYAYAPTPIEEPASSDLTTSGITFMRGASSVLALQLYTYEDSGLQNLKAITWVANAFAHGNSTDTDSRNNYFNEKSVRASAGYHVLKLNIYVSAAGANATARASWGSVISGQQDIRGRYVSDFYVSRYFANGFCLGRNAENYIAAYLHPTKGMTFEMSNNGKKFSFSNDGLNASGFLAGGVVNKWGYPTKKLGKFIESRKISQGRYRINHDVGHTNYVVSATHSCTDSDKDKLIARIIENEIQPTSCVIEMQWDGTAYDGGFMFEIKGEN